jgi:transcriptional regulator with XRE-family HTH domain
MMRTRTPNLSLSGIVGRIVASLRMEQGVPQVELAGRLGWDRSLLARIETGRNTANIEHLFELEEVFLADGLLESHGDLLELCNRVVQEARRRGARVMVGRSAEAGEQELETSLVDRLVARIVDDWLVELRAPRTGE